MVAAIGGPRRLSRQVTGVAQGLMIPLFFVVLGARLDLRALARQPSLLALVVSSLRSRPRPVVAAFLTGQPWGQVSRQRPSWASPRPSSHWAYRREC